MLNQIELASSTWEKLVTHITEEVDRLRKKNDGDLSPVETANIRGQIKALESVQKWACKRPLDVPVRDNFT